jgi:isopropylmalate/homocitrate/citramalate synthase
VLRTRLIIVALILAILGGVGLFFTLLWMRLPGSNAVPKIQNTATLLKQVQTLSELVTVKYVLEKVVILEDVRWYGENRLLMVAHGIVKAGVNLEEIRPEDFRLEGNRVILKVPRAMITDVYLDEQKTRVIDRATGLLRTFDKDLEQSARRQAVQDLRLAARYNGIYEDAEERARLQLSSLFHRLGYEVEFQKAK